MVLIQRGNVQLKVEDQELKKYLAEGFKEVVIEKKLSEKIIEKKPEEINKKNK